MLSDAERAEHRSLSERAWGRSAAPLTDDERMRLAQLERRRGGVEPEPAPAPAPAAAAAASGPRPSGGDQPSGGAEPAIESSAGQISSPGPTPASHPARPRRRGVLITAMILTVLAAAGAGWAAGALTSRPEPAASGALPPELLRPATQEDVVDASGLTVDPESTRFIARLRNVDIYLAEGAEAGSVCLVTVSPSVGPSAGCSSWSPTGGGVAVSVSNDLTIALGPELPGREPGSAFALSESVYAIRRG